MLKAQLLKRHEWSQQITIYIMWRLLLASPLNQSKTITQLNSWHACACYSTEKAMAINTSVKPVRVPNHEEILSSCALKFFWNFLRTHTCAQKKKKNALLSPRWQILRQAVVEGKLVWLWLTPLISNSLLEIKREKGGGTFREVMWWGRANHSTESLWVQ